MDHDARVRTSLLTAPRWVLVLVYGVPFGLWMGLFGRFAHHDSWTEALIGGVLAGLFFGIFMGMLTHRWNAQTRSAAGDLSSAGWWQVARAGRRGAVPDDPAIREAAAAILELRSTRMARQRPWAVPFTLLVLPARLRRRIELLRAEGTPAS